MNSKGIKHCIFRHEPGATRARWILCLFTVFQHLAWLPIITMVQFLPTATVAADRPNIVFVLTDDMGYSDLNCYGGNLRPTPNLDRLAKEGIRFTHFYDDAPICSPSRAAFITGMFPARWNFTTYLDNRAMNLDCEQADFLATNAPALARVLKAAGYADRLISANGIWAAGATSPTRRCSAPTAMMNISGLMKARSRIPTSPPRTGFGRRRTW